MFLYLKSALSYTNKLNNYSLFSMNTDYTVIIEFLGGYLSYEFFINNGYKGLDIKHETMDFHFMIYYL